MQKYKHIIYCKLLRFNSGDRLLTTKDLHYPWYTEGQYIHIPLYSFDDDDKLIEDLLILTDLGTAGYLTVKSEDGKLTKLLLIPGSVSIKAFKGAIRYPDKPYKTFTREKGCDK